MVDNRTSAWVLLLFPVLLAVVDCNEESHRRPPCFIPVGGLVEVPNSPYYWGNANTNITIVCAGKSTVWEYPGDFWPNKYSQNAEYSWPKSYKSSCQLKLVNVTHHATGYFRCSYDTKRENETTSTYVFIRDPTHLLVGEREPYYEAIGYRSVLIDCRPTFLDIDVSLWVKDGPMVDIDLRLNKFNESETRLTYRFLDGFTFINLDPNSSNHYECRGSRGNQTDTKDFNLFHLMHIDSVAAPTINGTNVRVKAGESLTLECTMSLDSTFYFSLSWLVPNPQATLNNRILIHQTRYEIIHNHHYDRKKFGTTLLTVMKATPDDAGKYQCIVADHLNNTNIATTTVRVDG